MASENVEVAALGYFIRQGLSPAQAAGIVGNLKQESGLNPKAPGGGLAQWLGSRLESLHNFAASRGASPESAGVQLEFIWHELTTTERGTLAALRKTSTPQAAARVFSEQYERPGIPMLPNRERYAVEAYRKAQKGQSFLSELGHLAEGPFGPGTKFEKEVNETGEEIQNKAGKLASGASSVLTGGKNAVEAFGTVASAMSHWIEEPLIPIKFIGGAVLVYVGVRTLTGGTVITREGNRAISHARELRAVAAI